MIDAYTQLQMMQQAGGGGLVNQAGDRLGIPGVGRLSPQARASGAGQLGAMAQQYGSPIAGHPAVNLSPLGGVDLGSGLFGQLATFGGNLALSGMLEEHGVTPMGGAGSYLQAQRARTHQLMVQQVSENVAAQDAEGIFRSMRGAASLAGMPMTPTQTEAARSLATTVAGFGPTLGLIAPQFLDAISGESGSVQAMAAQVMQGNRYRVDPRTGEMGYSAGSNTGLVEDLFETMFNDDHRADMQGLRAGDMGSLYSSLSDRGLAGPRGNLRDRTIRSLQQLRSEGVDLEDIGKAENVAVDGNLQGLSNADLAKLRGNSTVSDRITDSDTNRISGQLQEYVKSISAIREIFGENGNPNAPMPMLLGALEGLTGGRMHQFDPTRLTTMIRDMQALSQESGKSVDQLLAMNNSNTSNLNGLLGTRSGGAFAPTSTNYGVTTGQAFQQVGGATGFGTLSRTEAEQASMSMFNRGMSSEMANTLGALTRIENAGGFAGNDSGQDLKAALAAIDNGEEFYQDSNGIRRQVPTREREFRSFISGGAVEGMGLSGFNMMLGDKFSNLEGLSTDPDRQRGAVRQQFFDYEREVDRTSRSRLSGNKQLQDSGMTTQERDAAAADISTAALDAMFDLSAEDLMNSTIRQEVMVEAIQDAAPAGTYTDKQAQTVAEQIYGQSNRVARSRGAESTVAMVQMQGRKVSEAQRSAESVSDARAGLNEAMSNLGPKGGFLQRFFTSLQKQGDRGADADLTSLLTDMFGVDLNSDQADLMPLMESIRDKEKSITDKTNELRSGVGSKEERDKLQREIKIETEALEADVTAVRKLAVQQGLVGQGFNQDDVLRATEAFHEIDNLQVTSQARGLAGQIEITEQALTDAAESKLTVADRRVLAREQLKQEKADIAEISDELIQGEGDEADLTEGEQTQLEALRKNYKALAEGTKDFRSQAARDQTIAGLTPIDERESALETLKDIASPAAQKAVLQGRIANRASGVTSAAIDDRMAVKYKVAAEEYDVELASLEAQPEGDARDDAIADLKEERRKAQAAEFNTVRDELLLEDQFKRFGLEPDAAGDYSQAKVDEHVRQLLLTERGQQNMRDSVTAKDTENIAGWLSIADTTISEFVSDGGLTKSGESGKAAYTAARDARDNLQATANEYTGGNVAKLYTQGVPDEYIEDEKERKKAQQEIEKAKADHYEAIEALEVGARADYSALFTEDPALTPAEQQADKLKQATALAKSLIPEGEGPEYAAAVADTANELIALTGLSSEQVRLLQTQVRQDAKDEDRAAKLGVTTEEYRGMRQQTAEGKKQLKKLSLFSTPEDWDAAERRAEKLAEAKDNLANIDKAIAEEQAGAANPGYLDRMQKTRAERVAELDTAQDAVTADMTGAKFSDQEEYMKVLNKQTKVAELNRLANDYEGTGGLDVSPELLDKVNKRGEEEAEKLAALSLGEIEDEIAEAVGLPLRDTDEDAERTELGESLAGLSGDANMAMLAETFKKLGDAGEGETRLDKLNYFTDAYAGGEGDVTTLADEANMSELDFKRMMKNTEFLDMEGDDPYTQKDMIRQLEEYESRDIASEVSEELANTLTLEGTLNVVGDITGTATAVNLKGHTGAEGVV
tara:strand:+ start:21121 stop:25947 length:4827 start_codon:yes stop_codon:yes gene_type:complete